MALMLLFTVELRSHSGSISHNFPAAISIAERISVRSFVCIAFGSTILLIFILLLLFAQLLSQVINFFIGHWLGGFDFLKLQWCPQDQHCHHQTSAISVFSWIRISIFFTICTIILVARELPRFSPTSIFLITNILFSKVGDFFVLFTPFCKTKEICLFDGRHGRKNHNQLKRTALK